MTFKFSFACEVCPSSGQTDSVATKQHFRISACPKVQTSPQDSPTFAGAPPKKIQQSSLEKSRHLCQPYENKKNLSRKSSPIHVSHNNLLTKSTTWQNFYSFFIGDFFFSSHLFSRAGSGWSCFTGHVPFIYRRLRMCRETGPSPSHCSLGAGHLTGKRLVAVCDGARDAVKFQETGRIGGHSCMGDLGRPPVDQGIRE